MGSNAKLRAARPGWIDAAGGTEIAAGVISPSGEVLLRATRATDPTNRDQIERSVAEVVLELVTDFPQVAAVGVAAGGFVSPEFGKGFAVVAGEVKELAQETAKATEDIAGRVQSIQADTSGAVFAIGEMSSIIERINGIQLTITSAVEQQAATTQDMSKAAPPASGPVGCTSPPSGPRDADVAVPAGRRPEELAPGAARKDEECP